jgi:hypothetical protein
MSLDLELLRKLPSHDLETRLRSPRGVREYRFKGALLHDYAVASGLLGEGPSANQYYRATAGDGFVVRSDGGLFDVKWHGNGRQ